MIESEPAGIGIDKRAFRPLALRTAKGKAANSCFTLGVIASVSIL
jgi:hypothetical protein